MDITQQTSHGMAVGIATSSANVGLDVANVIPNPVGLAQSTTGLAQNVANLARDPTVSAQNATNLALDTTAVALNATNVALTAAALAQNAPGLAQTATATGVGQDIVGLTQNVVGLAWKGVAYLYNTAGLDTHLAQCMAEYQQEQYLEKSASASFSNSTIWKTTPAFHKEKFLLKIYKDVEQYIEDQAITDAELDGLNWQAIVTIYEDRNLPSIISRLSTCCISAKVRDITKTDMVQRFNIVSDARIGNVVLSNAFAMEREMRMRRQRAGLPRERHVVPILGRLLSLMPLCGIYEITLSDISMIIAPAIKVMALTDRNYSRQSGYVRNCRKISHRCPEKPTR